MQVLGYPGTRVPRLRYWYRVNMTHFHVFHIRILLLSSILDQVPGFQFSAEFGNDQVANKFVDNRAISNVLFARKIETVDWHLWTGNADCGSPIDVVFDCLTLAVSFSSLSHIARIGSRLS